MKTLKPRSMLRPLAASLFVGLPFATVLKAGPSWQLVDAPHESPSHLGYAIGDGFVVSASGRANLDALDFVNFQVGDFSLQGVVGEKAMSVGLTPGAFIDSWDLTDFDSLKMWVRLSGIESSGPVDFMLVDADGRRALHELLNVAADGEWHPIEVPLAALKSDSGFDKAEVVALQTGEGFKAAGESEGNYQTDVVGFFEN